MTFVILLVVDTVGVKIPRLIKLDSVWKNNPEYQRKRRGRRLYWIGKYKLSKGCEVCGYNKNSSALDFDHLIPEDKKFNLSTGSMLLSLKRIIQEIRKCRILCANCHRIHTVNTVRL